MATYQVTAGFDGLTDKEKDMATYRYDKKTVIQAINYTDAKRIAELSADLGEAPRPGSAMESNMDLIMDIPIDLQIVLGSSQMQVSSLMNLSEGATIALDRRIGEPVEVMVNGRIIGRGEITVLENDDTRFGVKLIEVKSTRKI